MEEIMTDKQIEIILNLVADKFAGCENMEDVKKAIQEVREMAKKEKPAEQQVGSRQRRAGLPPLPYLVSEQHTIRKFASGLGGSRGLFICCKVFQNPVKTDISDTFVSDKLVTKPRKNVGSGI